MGWSGDLNASLGTMGSEGGDGEGGLLWQADPHHYPTTPNPHHTLLNITAYTNGSVVSRPEVLGPGYHKQLRQGMLAVMFVVALVGNCWVMVTLKAKWATRGRMTVLTFNLTLADLLVTLLTILGQLIWEMVDMRWYLGGAACKVYKVASTFAITSSNYMLVALAIDRHEAIVRPLNPFISAKNLALAAWAVSLLPSLPNFIIFVRHVTPGGDVYCVSKFYTKELDTSFRQVYLGIVLTLVFVSCQVLILVFNLRVYFTIWRQSSFFRGGQREGGESQRTNSLLAKAKTKTLNMTIVISLAFFLTNTPYVIQELIMAFGDMHKIHPNVLALFGIISASNSALNPFIYLLFCPKEERRSPESYRVTFSRRWNTLNNRSPSAPAFAQACTSPPNTSKCSK